MHEMGSIALVPIEDGQILNAYSGNRLNRVQFLNMEHAKQLCGIFKETNVKKNKTQEKRLGS